MREVQKVSYNSDHRSSENIIEVLITKAQNVSQKFRKYHKSSDQRSSESYHRSSDHISSESITEVQKVSYKFRSKKLKELS